MNLIEQIQQLVHAGSTPRERHAATSRKNALRAIACREFARLNGWNVARTSFSLKALVEGRPHTAGYGSCSQRDVDHGEYYREPTRPFRAAAVVAHLYCGSTAASATPETSETIARASAWAESVGLTLREPPRLGCSWYYPNGTLMVAYTRQDAVVEWPDFDALVVPAADERLDALAVYS